MDINICTQTRLQSHVIVHDVHYFERYCTHVLGGYGTHVVVSWLHVAGLAYILHTSFPSVEHLDVFQNQQYIKSITPEKVWESLSEGRTLRWVYIPQTPGTSRSPWGCTGFAPPCGWKTPWDVSYGHSNACARMGRPPRVVHRFGWNVQRIGIIMAGYMWFSPYF